MNGNINNNKPFWSQNMKNIMKIHMHKNKQNAPLQQNNL